MDRDRELLRHFLAAIAYRTQKALRGAPGHYPAFSAGNRVRTPVELIRHMTALMGYVRTFFQGGSYPMKPDPLPTFQAEVERFHELIQAVGALLASDATCSLSSEQLLQGPFRADRLHADEPPPARPDTRWPEAPK